MEDRERALGDAGVDAEATAAILRIDAAVLVLLWIGAVVGWAQLPERFPIHFDAFGGADGWATRNPGGLILWLLLPAMATIVSFVMRWARRAASASPAHWSIPRKREFLALTDEERAPIVSLLTRMMAVATLITTLMLALVQLAIYRGATGADFEAGLTFVLFALAGFLVAYALWETRRATRLIEKAVEKRARSAGTALACACLLLFGACGQGYGAAEPEPESASQPTQGDSIPVRAHPESGVAVDPDSALRAELIEMGREDQRVRTGLTPEMITDTAFVRRLMRTDSALSIRLRQIVETHGWPDAARVGRSAVHAAFLIVQHTPFDDFREAMLLHVERDARAGVLDAQDYAAMADRIRRHRGEPQLYGTQYSLVDGYLIRDTVENPDELERRREELGLMPIAEYERLLADFYSAPVRREAP